MELRGEMSGSQVATRLMGRSAEVGVLESGLRTALERRGGVALLAGEAGVGKTRLLREAASRAREHGFRILTAACYVEN